MLDSVVPYIDQVLKGKKIAIKESFEKSMIHVYTDHDIPIFDLLKRQISYDALDLLSGNPIPLDAIDVFWRKPNMSLSKVVNEGDEINVNETIDLVKEHINKQPSPLKKSLLAKIKLVINPPQKTDKKEPVVQTKPRGRSSLKARHVRGLRYPVGEGVGGVDGKAGGGEAVLEPSPLGSAAMV